MVEKIRALCRNSGITLYRLEQLLGFSHNSIRKWDDHSPSFEKVIYVAEYFGISVNDLVPKEEK